MIWYLFTEIGFPPGDSGRYTCTNFGKRQRKRETIHKTVKNNTETQNTQYRTQKYKTKNIKEYKKDILIPSSLLHVLRHPSNTTPVTLLCLVLLKDFKLMDAFIS